MSAKFLIQPDPDNRLVRAVMTGFFTAADFSRFLSAGDEARAQIGLPPGEQLTLIDVRRMKIQSVEIVEAIARALADPDRRSRLAFVVGPTLFRAQLARAFGDREACCFDTVEEAEAFLLGGEEGQASAEAA